MHTLYKKLKDSKNSREKKHIFIDLPQNLNCVNGASSLKGSIKGRLNEMKNLSFISVAVGLNTRLGGSANCLRQISSWRTY